MPSSTSSSRAPPGPWRSIWMLTVLITATVGVGWEVTLRAIGFRPNLRDDPAIWALHRDRASAEGVRPLILLGGSRMQVDVDPVVLGDYLNRRVIQLAIDGSNPMPVLADLANDEGFRGDVWVSLRVENLFGLPQGRSPEYVTHFREVRANFNTRWNTAAMAAVDSRLALRNGLTSLRGLMSRSAPTPSYISMRADRYLAVDYGMVDIEAHRAARIRRNEERYEYWADHTPTVRLFDDSLAVLEERVQAIHQRGGEVALIRFPTGSTLWATAESVFPRDTFWDRLSASSSATVLHYRDEAGLSSFTLPDESHVDFRDAPAFTRALAAAVSRR